MITNKYSIREQNEILVLSTIIHSVSISRAAISQLTGLNKASTSDIVKKLVEEELVIETGSGTSTSSGGRKPILLELNKEAGCSLSIDIGNDYITSILTNLSGEWLAEATESGTTIDKDNIVAKVKEIVQKYKRHYSKRTFGLTGITLAIHGIVYENAILFTPYSNLDEIKLAEKLEEILKIPVFLENEANLSVLGEKTFAVPKKNLISVSIHRGVGAGILIDGEIYQGNRGQAGEIGHTIIQPHGIACPCGNEGCMEQYCSEAAILALYRELKTDETATLDQLCQGYNANGVDEVTLVKDAVLYLSIGINNLIAHFDPEYVILNSQLFHKLPFLITLVQDEISSKFAKEVPLMVSTMGEQAILMGGIVTNLQNFFNIPNLNFFIPED